jgi:hypothetical protein
MAEKSSQAQADKKAAEDRTAEVGQDNAAKEANPETSEATSAAAKVLQVDPADAAVNPYPAYDFMTLEQLRDLAEERGVEINRDVEKAHLITELRAKDTQA